MEKISGLVSDYNDMWKRFDSAPYCIFILSLIEIGICYITTFLVIDTNNQYIEYINYFIKGYMVVIAVCCVIYYVCLLLCNTRRILSVILFLMMFEMVVIFNMSAVLNVFNNCEYTVSRIIALIIIFIMGVWICINAFWFNKDLKAGYFIRNVRKISSQKIPFSLVIIIIFSWIPAMAHTSRRHARSIIEQEVVNVYLVYLYATISGFTGRFFIKCLYNVYWNFKISDKKYYELLKNKRKNKR